jgi:hypothetical protein
MAAGATLLIATKFSSWEGPGSWLSSEAVPCPMNCKIFATDLPKSR